MKVTHLISSGGLFGAEYVVLTLSKLMQNSGHDITIGAIYDDRNPQVEILEQAKKMDIPTLMLKSKGRFDRAPIKELHDYLNQDTPDVLHTHNYKSNMIGLSARRHLPVSLMATAHGYTESSRMVSVYEALDKFLLKTRFDRVVPVTEEMLKTISKRKRKVILNGIDIQKFNIQDDNIRNSFRKKYNIDDKDQVIAVVGRLSIEKNQKLLLATAKELLLLKSPFKILVVGSGPEEKHLKKFVEEYYLSDTVIFTGKCDDMLAVYNAMDILVMPSLTEGIPLTLLEAMAARKPILASCVGGIPTIIKDEKTGKLFPSQNQGLLTEDLKLFLTQKLPTDTWVDNAFEYVQAHFSQEQMMKNYLKVYEEIV